MHHFELVKHERRPLRSTRCSNSRTLGLGPYYTQSTWVWGGFHSLDCSVCQYCDIWVAPRRLAISALIPWGINHQRREMHFLWQDWQVKLRSAFHWSMFIHCWCTMLLMLCGLIALVLFLTSYHCLRFPFVPCWLQVKVFHGAVLTLRPVEVSSSS